jgi:hypothetical protein
MNDQVQKPRGTFAKLMGSTPPPVIQSPASQEVETETKAVEEPKIQPIESKKEDKKLLGSRITKTQYTTFKKLYLKLNTNDSAEKIDKGEITGLAIETLDLLLEGLNESFPTIDELKSYLVNKLTSYRNK